MVGGGWRAGSSQRPGTSSRRQWDTRRVEDVRGAHLLGQPPAKHTLPHVNDGRPGDQGRRHTFFAPNSAAQPVRSPERRGRFVSRRSSVPTPRCDTTPTTEASLGYRDPNCWKLACLDYVARPQTQTCRACVFFQRSRRQVSVNEVRDAPLTAAWGRSRSAWIAAGLRRRPPPAGVPCRRRPRPCNAAFP